MKSKFYLVLLIIPTLALCKELPELKLKPEGIFTENKKFYYSIIEKKTEKIVAKTFISCVLDGNIMTITDSLNNSVIDVDVRTLRPIEGHWTIEYEGVYEVFTYFTEDSIFVDAETPVGPQKVSLAMPDGIMLHNDELLMGLRSMDFTTPKQRLKLFVPANASIINMVVIVKGKEKIAVPAGKFETYKTILDFGVGSQTAWFEVAKPHRLIQYENDAIKYKLE